MRSVRVILVEDTWVELAEPVQPVESKMPPIRTYEFQWKKWFTSRELNFCGAKNVV
jgi:hypothetical protein